MNTTFTAEQLKVHGEKIIDYLNNGTNYQVLNTNGIWVTIKKPMFDKNQKYRKQEEPLFVNELGDIFTKHDNDTDVYWFDFDDLKVCDEKFDNLCPDEEMKGDHTFTDICRTPKQALELGLKHFDKNYKNEE
ncbi:hypothetical protein HYO65_gp054 [Tenacibaculum phage PTm1]|uniref:Uncharacterized protein n=2 Tax=Shirahamavirus PTm1 TaxID=2846435 RepID=A0A5S9HX88_9CAUD|nr:hypothetical protein HYO65_gp054 [Tenacibaculum phage PTm1]BBI90446.1 hypothetical protein [Tenacibaculum phage PTm1]BBI90754.1 hypothetical protein [Tenacibaculum phage PTm5]